MTIMQHVLHDIAEEDVLRVGRPNWVRFVGAQRVGNEADAGGLLRREGLSVSFTGLTGVFSMQARAQRVTAGLPPARAVSNTFENGVPALTGSASTAKPRLLSVAVQSASEQ